MTSVAMFQARLFGTDNRIKWSAADVARIAERLGVNASAAASLPIERSALPSLTVVKDSSASDKSYTFTISTPTVDRSGDTIAVDGWKLDAFRKNPIVLYGHNQAALPVGAASRTWIEGQRLKASMRFAPGPEAAQVRQLVEAGILKATSVGFRPLKWSFSDDKSRSFGINFYEQELLEFSIVSVPANAEALIDVGQPKSMAARRRERDLDLIRIRGFNA